MKYLKKFENEDVLNVLPKLKKYIIWGKLENNTCSILENTNKIEISGNKGEEKYYILVVVHLYTYMFNTNNLISKKDFGRNIIARTSGLVYDKLPDNIEKYVMYQSEDLQDCIKQIEILAMSKKYNVL